MPKTRVVICGNSMLLAGVRTLLEGAPGIEMVPFTPGFSADGLSSPAELERLHPDVVLFDAVADDSRLLLNAFRQFPGLRLIGLQGTEQQAIVVQGRRRQVVGPGDLEQLILEAG